MTILKCIVTIVNTAHPIIMKGFQFQWKTFGIILNFDWKFWTTGQKKKDKRKKNRIFYSASSEWNWMNPPHFGGLFIWTVDISFEQVKEPNGQIKNCVRNSKNYPIMLMEYFHRKYWIQYRELSHWFDFHVESWEPVLIIFFALLELPWCVILW